MEARTKEKEEGVGVRLAGDWRGVSPASRREQLRVSSEPCGMVQLRNRNGYALFPLLPAPSLSTINSPSQPTHSTHPLNPPTQPIHSTRPLHLCLATSVVRHGTGVSAPGSGGRRVRRRRAPAPRGAARHGLEPRDPGVRGSQRGLEDHRHHPLQHRKGPSLLPFTLPHPPSIDVSPLPFRYTSYTPINIYRLSPV